MRILLYTKVLSVKIIGLENAAVGKIFSGLLVNS